MTDILDVLALTGPGGSCAYALPTGGGKTVVGIELLRYCLDKMSDRIHAWATHRKELRDQSGNRIEGAGLRTIDMSAVQPNKRAWYRGGINVVSPSIRKWPQMASRPGLLIVDECHHSPASTFGRLIRAWREAGGIVVGLTATMWRLSKREGFEDYFDDLIHGPDVEWLIENNYLARPIVHIPDAASIQMDDKEDVNSMGDYEIRALDRNVSMVLAHDPVMRVWEQQTRLHKPDDRRTLWFVPTVHCAKMLSKMQGRDSAVLTAETPRDERVRTLDALKDRKLTHLVSVSVLSEGLDIPDVPVVACLRPTMSLVDWLQLLGRGGRAKGERGVYGGEYLAIDYAKNTIRHGMPDVAREWSLEPRVRFEGKGMEPPYGLCRNPECHETPLHPSARSCRVCGIDQYFPCGACHVDRRWTQFIWYKDGSISVCKICRQLQRELQEELANESVPRKTYSDGVVPKAPISYKGLHNKFHKPGRFARKK